MGLENVLTVLESAGKVLEIIVESSGKAVNVKATNFRFSPARVNGRPWVGTADQTATGACDRLAALQPLDRLYTIALRGSID